MVEDVTMTEPASDAKKAEGNEAFKRGDYRAAIALYTEAANIQPTEQILSNRAACFIALRQYRRAVEDCQAGIRINSQFARIYKRLYKAQLALGRVPEAKEALDMAVELDPNDATNAKDRDTVATVIHQLEMLEKFTNEADTDYARAVVYCGNILTNCPVSIQHCALKCEYLLRAYQLKEASKFSNELMQNPDMMDVPLIKSWRGRIVIYCGQENMGKNMLQEVLRLDPDQTDAMRTMKLIRTSAQKKEEASQVFKQNNFEQAIVAFNTCLALDPLNLTYNSTICLNKAICHVKLGQNEEALATLNLCLKMQPEYHKALVKRGEVNQNLEMWEEAVADYSAAQALDPAGLNITQKLQYAQQEAKKARKKDYYKILGVAKDAPEKTIKTAYRKMALKWHPDKNNESDEQKSRAEKMFKEVNEAWAVLSDPQKRQQHDMGMSMDDMTNNGAGGMGGAGFPGGMSFNMGGMPGGGAGGMPFDPNDIFKMFFSQNMEEDGGFGHFMNAGGARRGGAGGAQGFPGGFGGMPGFGGMGGGMPGSAKKGGGRGGRSAGPTFTFGQM